ncbi:hypothetical protein DY000_02042729 [Brassica cretica]|uniref:PPM-type phosphatase domain-containing protein n=1 Tax=Brassica cretica TaxID=69181 RepID=A0ABQ7B9X0_BRACR|nr:hypothetical protein DY000_02042729 [Brassica cretica]
MVLLPAFLDGLARSVSLKKGKYIPEDEDGGGEIAKSLMKDAKKNLTLLGSSGFVKSETSKRFTSICSNRGEKGINQDRAIVWEEFGCQEDITFCGMFDGHGPWGHVITKRVKKLFPSSLLCQWQQTLASLSLSPECFSPFDIWKQSCLKTFSLIDLDLKIHPSIDSYCSGCTALTAVLQGDHLVVANAGDSRAVIATTSDDGSGLVPVQLSVDFKPNIPGISPKAFPYLTVKVFRWKDSIQLELTIVEIVRGVKERRKSAKRLVERAMMLWRRKRRSIAMDDISALCLFFHPS